MVNYYHGDALGTTRAMTTQGRTQTDTRETDAFGNLWGPGSNLATPTPFGYAGAWGYQTDADSGLMLLGHRYYDASVGRFISRDPINAGYNWYAYVNNDPVNAVDPTGLDETETKVGVGIGVGKLVFKGVMAGLAGIGGAATYLVWAEGISNTDAAKNMRRMQSVKRRLLVSHSAPFRTAPLNPQNQFVVPRFALPRACFS